MKNIVRIKNITSCPPRIDNTMSFYLSKSDPNLVSQLIINLDLLPPHDPNRFRSLDSYDDPTTTNSERASFAIDALAAFQKFCPMNEKSSVAVADLICDLLHLVHSEECSPKDVLKSALIHFIAEAG